MGSLCIKEQPCWILLLQKQTTRAVLGIEPRTSRTRGENHTTRPNSQLVSHWAQNPGRAKACRSNVCARSCVELRRSGSLFTIGPSNRIWTVWGLAPSCMQIGCVTTIPTALEDLLVICASSPHTEMTGLDRVLVARVSLIHNYMTRHCVRVAKEMDLKSIGLWPQGFESPRCRFVSLRTAKNENRTARTPSCLKQWICSFPYF